MDVKKTVDEWVLEYTAKNQLYTVTGAVLSRLSAPELPDVQLACCTLHDIINNSISELDPVVLELALELLDFIYTSLPEAVTFKLYSKLAVGLKMLIVLLMLKNKDKDCLTKLMKYFPRSVPKYPGVCHSQLSHLHIVHNNFRRFYLPLLANSRQAEAYFREEFAEEYGSEFHKALQKMCSWFVDKIQCKFPKPMLTKIMENPDFLREFQNSPDIQILMDTIHNKTSLTSHDLLDLLTMVDPACTQDRIQVPDTFSLSPRRSRCQCEMKDVNTSSYNSNNQNNHCNMHVHYSEISVEDLLQGSDNFGSRQPIDSLCCSFSGRTNTDKEFAHNNITTKGKTTQTSESSNSLQKILRNGQTSNVDTHSGSLSSKGKSLSLMSPEEHPSDKTVFFKDSCDFMATSSPLENLSLEDPNEAGRLMSNSDQISDDIEHQTGESASDSSGGDISLQRYQVPDITQHQRQIPTPLCIVKLYKTQVFQKHNIYC